MKPKIYKGTKNDFSLYVRMALQDRMPWKILAMLLKDVAPTLNETREIISILLKELETLNLAFQEKQEELKMYQFKGENVFNATNQDSLQGYENLVDSYKIKEATETPTPEERNSVENDFPNESIESASEDYQNISLETETLPDVIQECELQSSEKETELMDDEIEVLEVNKESINEDIVGMGLG